MNIATPQPAINLNTSNVYTETARRDNQLREVIPKPAPSNESHTENKALNDGEKSRSHLNDDSGTYDSTGQLQQNKVIAEDDEQREQQSKGGSQEETSEQEQQNQEAEQQQIEELKTRDREVRLHEQAHAPAHANAPLCLEFLTLQFAAAQLLGFVVLVLKFLLASHLYSVARVAHHLQQ